MLTFSSCFSQSSLAKKYACSQKADNGKIPAVVGLKEGKTQEGHIESSVILQLVITGWNCIEVYVWVEVQSPTIVRYVNCTVIISLRWLRSHCSCQGARPYKYTGLPRVPSNGKQMSQKTALSVSQGRWDSLPNQWYCELGVIMDYTVQVCRGEPLLCQQMDIHM